MSELSEDKKEDARLSREDVRGALKITGKQFRTLTRSPAFPKPVIETKFEILWSRKAIHQFAKKMKKAKKKGWKTPDCFYLWLENE